MVQDPSLLRQVPILQDARPWTYLLVNTSRALPDLGISAGIDRMSLERVAMVPATDLARELLGRPLPNTALLGAFAALTDIVSLEALVTAIRARFRGQVATGNVAAATRAYTDVRARVTTTEEVNHA